MSSSHGLIQHPGTPTQVRVLMIGPGLQVRGGISSVEKLILEFVPHWVRVQHVATMVDGSRAVKLWTFLKSLQTIERARSSNDIAHIHFASDASSVRKEIVARRLIAGGQKVIMHAHGAEYQRYWREMSGPSKKRTLAVLRATAALIVLGNSWKEFFLDIGVPQGQIVIMPNPVKLPAQVPTRRSGDRLTFLFLGIIDFRKGAFDLVEAIRALPIELRREIRFVFAGNGEVSALRTLVRRYALESVIEVRSWVEQSERDRLLAETACFILPSRDEGMPMALLEAMAWGAAVVATPVGSIPEVVTAEQNGILVEPGNVAAITGAIARLATNENERLRMGAAARDAVQSLSAEHYAHKLASLYQKIARVTIQR